MLNRIASSGANLAQVILQPGMSPPLPPTGYSLPFDVGADPRILLASAMQGETDGWEATVQVSPDGGETYTDLIIHTHPVVLNATASMVKIPVTGRYRLRTTAALTTFVVYSMLSTHEPDLPLANLSVPGPTGATGTGGTGPTGPTGPSGPSGGPTGATGPAMWPTPYDFGAVGDGVTDDTIAMQDWLNAVAGGVGYGKAGSFLCTSTIAISGETTIYGAGKSSFKILAATSDMQLMGNKHAVYPGGPINAVVVNNPGVNYVVGDTGTVGNNNILVGPITGGFASSAYTVTGVDGGGGITSLTFTPGGNYFTFDGVMLVNGGSQPGIGTGATINVTADSPNRIDKNISISGICFEDVEAVNPGLGDWVDFIGVDGLVIRDCLFQHHHKSLLILSNNNNMTIDNNEFFDWGDGSPFLPNNFTGGMGIFCLSPSYNTRIINNYLHEAENGGGIWLPVTNPVIPSNPEGSFFVCSNNIIYLVCENGIVGAPDGSIIDNNIIFGVALKDVSGHGAEIHGTDFSFCGNVIQTCAHTCAYFYNISNVQINNNLFNLPNQNIDNWPCVAISYLPTNGSFFEEFAPYNVTMVGNQFSSADGKGLIGVQFVKLGGDPTKLMNLIQMSGNNFGPIATWSTGPISFFPSANEVIGVDFVHRNNVGTLDCDPYTGDFLIPNGGSGNITVTGIPFKPRTLLLDAIIPGNLASRCIETVRADLTNFSNSTASDANGSMGSTSFGLKLYDGLSNLLTYANVTSYTPDGFIVGIVGTSGANVYVNYTAFP